MDPVTLLIIAALVIGGIALGWVLGKGRAGAVAEERGKAAEQLRADLAAVTGERDTTVRELAALQADARNFEARMKEFRLRNLDVGFPQVILRAATLSPKSDVTPISHPATTRVLG